ncbi:hypothetical protein LSH36_471g05010 [Paralvinella palmiformis]|uniref:Uncharacterized protein n=1 Tax=Paralvinella palmiformis TaxID=53620 RepID=A0AAD9MZS6_9ANNE|nr:hypothetical protein LSH36_471g05010 [Paralvinella palmiformis]
MDFDPNDKGSKRFYGKSLPFDVKKTYQHPYVDLLTVEQAMGDFAVFIDWFKTSVGAKDNPVIAFGGSYGGMLSAYMRFKYPNLISGSIAASAPIYLTAGVSSRRFFFEDVTQDFKTALSGCADGVRQGFRQMFNVISKGKQGLQQISEVFNLCSPLTQRQHVEHLVGWIRNAFTYLAMLDYPYPTVFMSPLPGHPVKNYDQTTTT